MPYRAVVTFSGSDSDTSNEHIRPTKVAACSSNADPNVRRGKPFRKRQRLNGAKSKGKHRARNIGDGEYHVSGSDTDGYCSSRSSPSYGSTDVTLGSLLQTYQNGPHANAHHDSDLSLSDTDEENSLAVVPRVALEVEASSCRFMSDMSGVSVCRQADILQDFVSITFNTADPVASSVGRLLRNVRSMVHASSFSSKDITSLFRNSNLVCSAIASSASSMFHTRMLQFHIMLHYYFTYRWLLSVCSVTVKRVVTIRLKREAVPVGECLFQNVCTKRASNLPYRS